MIRPEEGFLFLHDREPGRYESIAMILGGGLRVRFFSVEG